MAARITIGRPPGGVKLFVPTSGAGGTPQTAFTAHVYTKEHWNDLHWTRQPYLQAVTSSEAALPSRGTATFVYDFGHIKREDSGALVSPSDQFAKFIAGEFSELFVTIRVIPRGQPGYNAWTGVIPIEEVEIHGTKTVGAPPNNTFPSGKQAFTAFGLEYLLERRRVVGAYVNQVLTVLDEFGDPADPLVQELQVIPWTPTFNLRSKDGSSQPRGNRSAVEIQYPADPATDFDMVPVFSTERDGVHPLGGFLWSRLDIIKYLFTFTNPMIGNEPDFVPPSIATLQKGELVDYFDAVDVVVDADKLTVKGVLDLLLPRTRGVGGRFVVTGRDARDMPSGDVELQLFSMVDAEISLGLNRPALPKNPLVETIKLDEGVDKASAIVSVDSTATYDRVLVRGNRLVTNFSAAIWTATTPFDEDVGNNLLARWEKGWTDAQENAYKHLTDDQRKKIDSSPVYRRFVAPKDFDWHATQTTLAEGVIDDQNLNPRFDKNANIQTLTFDDQGLAVAGEAFWNTEKPILPALKIVDVDAPVDPDGTPQFLRPFVVFKSLGGATAGKWFYGDEPPDGIPPATLVIVKGSLALDVRYTERHTLAKTHFELPYPDPDYVGAPPVPTLVARSKFPTVVNYEQMILTVAVEADSRPVVDINLPHTPIRNRTLIIDVPGVEVWYMPNDSVIGVNPDGTLKQFKQNRLEDGGGFGDVLRDDTQRLRDIGAVVAGFYGKPRKAVNVTLHGLFRSYQVGVFLDSTFLDEQRTEVKAPVTERKLDYVAGTTTIVTGFLELDVASL